MNPLLGLTEYLRNLERNFRLLAYSRGAALIGGAALLFTVLLVLIANAFAFSDPSVFWSRVVLFLAIAFALGAGLIVPVMRLNRRWAARKAEEKYPELQQRLLTFTEKSSRNAGDPFLPLLAADAMEVVSRRTEPIVPRSWIVSLASAAVVAVTILLWLGISGPGFLGYGTALLWGTVPKEGRAALYTIRVQPGTKLIRRRSDQVVTAELSGFSTGKVSLFAKYATSGKWEEAPMQARQGASGFQFQLASVPEDVEYYISAGGVKSGNYKLTVVDLPGVKNIKVTYHYPAVLGLKNEVEDPGGDLRALEGTEAELEITTDKPLAHASLMLDSGSKIDLENRDGKLFARVPVQKDDMYHVATPEQGEMVRLTEDYFIEARKDSAPVVSILKPGKDAKASPIEEVAMRIQGKDDFGLRALDLHYSVNGAPEKVLSLLKNNGAKEADGSATLALEDYKLEPGDIVSFYATAKDARTTSKTDIYFIEAQPFEKEYSQSQQTGGGGGGEGEQDKNISQREKEVIAATWNQLKEKEKGGKSAADNAKYLADVQGKLKEQAQSLANRMKARQLSENNPAFKSFTEDMEKAVGAMGPASDQLKGMKWQDALQPEQKALQYLLRAEATFRQIQVAFGKQGGGGGGGGGASRDLENLFDLELDTEKNQYEAAQQSPQEKKLKAIDDAMAKLEQLAKRQEELAQQRNQQNQAQQRWQQEMLRREAEQLRQKMEQLSRNQDQGQQSSQGQQGQQSQSQSGQQGAQGQQSGQPSGQQGQQQGSQGGQQSGQSQGTQQAGGQKSPQRGNQQQSGQQQSGQQQNTQQRQLDQALNRLSEATRDMSQAASQQQNSQNGQQGQAEARKAAESLREARDTLAGMRQQQTGDQLQNIAQEAEQLAAQQKDFEQRMRKNFGGETGQDPQAKRQLSTQMAGEKEKMSTDYDRMEKEIQNAARTLQSTQPEASRKLRDAVGNLQQEEVKARMQTSASYLRRGLGSYTVMGEAPVTQALNQLKDDLRQAQSAMGKGTPGQQPSDQALAQAQKLRQDIEKLARSAQPGGRDGQGKDPGQRGEGQAQSGNPGQESKQGQGQQGQGQQGQGQQGQGQQGQGQQGQGQQGQGQQGQGQQPGGQQGQGQPGGGQQAGGNQPGGQQQNGGAGFGGSFGPNGPNMGAWSDAQRDLSRLQNTVRDNQDMTRQLRDLQGRLQGIDPRQYKSDPALLEKRISDFLGDMEAVEVALRRNADAAGGSPRMDTPRQVPPGYANAVAEYYRRLSKQ